MVKVEQYHYTATYSI